MRSIIKHKKGQAESIIVFFFLAVAILIASIIVLRITNSILTPLGSAIGNYSAPAGAAVVAVHNSFTTTWDYFIILLLALNILTLLISSFMVDVHPAFAIVYIIAFGSLLIFGNFALGALDKVWYYTGRASIEGTQTTLQQFVINNFQIIMLGIILLSGILMYAKFKYFSQQGGNYG